MNPNATLQATNPVNALTEQGVVLDKNLAAPPRLLKTH
jgi:hypothetical protein